MASIEKLIELKTKRLESVPDELLTRIERIQKEVFPQVLDLIGLLDRSSDGTILLTDKNLEILATAQGQLRDVLLQSEYTEAVNEFVEEFEVQKGVSAELFRKTFVDFVTEGNAGELVELAQQRALKIFRDGIADSAFADSIYNQMELAIANSASYGDTVREIQRIVLGDSEEEGKLLRYSKQVAHDQFALSDRSYTSAVAEEMKAEWFFYSGNKIPTSRQFCVDRHNHYYYYKEIEEWARLDWDGKIDGTNEKTIFSTAGGWNCRHTIIPVSIRIVPKEVIERNIKNGNFEPSEFERQELGLAA